MKEGKLIYSKTSIILTLLLMLLTIVAINHFYKSYHVIYKMEEICHDDNKSITLNNIIPLKWDTLYIVYGPSLSEFLEWDYNITSKNNTTTEEGISLYFVLNKKVVYIENDDNYQKNRGDDFGYIRFNDDNFPSRSRSRSTPAAIYTPSTILIKIKKDRFTDGEPFVCELSPLDQQK